MTDLEARIARLEALDEIRQLAATLIGKVAIILAFGMWALVALHGKIEFSHPVVCQGEPVNPACRIIGYRLIQAAGGASCHQQATTSLNRLSQSFIPLVDSC